MKADLVAIVIRVPSNYWEGLRSGLGLSLEMIEAHVFVLGEVNMPEDRVEGYKENLEDQLIGQPLEAGLLLGIIESFYSKKGIQSPGVSPEDMVSAILRNRN